jgi:DNA-binding transcriptional LysR family regulator
MVVVSQKAGVAGRSCPIFLCVKAIRKRYALIDLRRLRYFVAVAEERSVGRAAERLGMAQPPLSVQIRKLEREVGVVLFRRGARGMEMTDAGSAFLSRAKEALALSGEAVEAARAVAAGRRGRLTVGYMFTLAYSVLPTLVPDLRRTLPDVDLDFVEMSAATREPLVLDRQVTIGLCMPAIRHPEVETEVVGAQPAMVALPARSALARLGAVPVHRLREHRLIGLPRAREGAVNVVVASLLRRHGVTMQTAHAVETVYSALGLVLAGEGIAILPAGAALGRPPGVVFRPLQGATDAFEIAACWRRDSLNPLIGHALDVVRSLPLSVDTG